MVTLADVMARHGDDYLGRFGSAVPSGHLRAMRAITRCRTGALGGHLAQCADCGRQHLLYHSCRHRACPRCGHEATDRWLERQRQLLLPVPYFHVVFTLPAELRRLVRSHQRELIALLFRAAFQSLQALCADPKWLGGRVGALAVLHTWTRTLEWHPHLHLLVPAGALAPDGRTWLTPPTYRKQFLVPVRALGKHFRARFLHLARRALPETPFPKIPWDKPWVVFAKPAAQPQRVLDYLGRYVHRTALSDKAIATIDHNTVSFCYRDSRDHQLKSMNLHGHEFLRRFLQHVPLKGLHRIRSYGLLHSRQRTTLKQLQRRLTRPATVTCATPAQSRVPTPPRRCPHCQSTRVRGLRHLTAPECALHDAAAIASNARAVAGLARAPPPSSASGTAAA